MQIDDFIQSAVSQLGLDQEQARQATGSAFGFIQKQMGGDFSKLASHLPGVEELIGAAQAASAPAEEEGGGGLLGSLSKAASDMLGGGAGETFELMGAMKGAGLSVDQGSSLLAMLINLVKEKLGAETLAAIAAKIPALKPFLG